MKKKFNLFISAEKWDWQDDFKIRVDGFDYAASANVGEHLTVIPICEREIEIDVPEINKKTFVDVEIEQLQSEITQVNASAYVKVMEIKDKINKLQALEHLESADNDDS